MGKATKAQIKKRVSIVFDLLLVGASRASIIEYCMKQDWNIKVPTVDTYIRKANDIFILEADARNSEQFSRAIMRLESLYQKNLSIQDYRTALATQKELNTLLGLYAPAKTAVSHDGKLQIEYVYPDNDPNDSD